MSLVVVKFRRNDQDPPDHFYGDPIDREIDDLVGGPDALGPDRYGPGHSYFQPMAVVRGTEIVLSVQEDGPLVQFLIEQIPAFISAFSGLVSAWYAWRPKAIDGQPPPGPSMPREVVITIGEHSYTGRPKNKEELQQIFKFLTTLESEGTGPPTA